MREVPWRINLTVNLRLLFFPWWPCVWMNTGSVSRAIWTTDEMKFVLRFLNLRRPFKKSEEWKKRDSPRTAPSEAGCLGLLAPSSVPFHFGSLLSGSNFGLLPTYVWWVGDIWIKTPTRKQMGTISFLRYPHCPSLRFWWAVKKDCTFTARGAGSVLPALVHLSGGWVVSSAFPEFSFCHFCGLWIHFKAYVWQYPRLNLLQWFSLCIF